MGLALGGNIMRLLKVREWFDTCQELTFAPKEIKTVLRKNSGFVECNMLEEDTVEK